MFNITNLTHNKLKELLSHLPSHIAEEKISVTMTGYTKDVIEYFDRPPKNPASFELDSTLYDERLSAYKETDREDFEKLLPQLQEADSWDKITASEQWQ